MSDPIFLFRRPARGPSLLLPGLTGLLLALSGCGSLPPPPAQGPVVEPVPASAPAPACEPATATPLHDDRDLAGRRLLQWQDELRNATGEPLPARIARLSADTPTPAHQVELGLVLLHTRNPNVDLSTLREFYPDTAVPLAHILRAIVGLDHEAVDAKFTAFAQSHALTSQQLRFLAMLKDHIRQFGAIAVAQLFDAPFNSLHAEGLGGVFPNQTQLDELVALVRGFGEPLQPPAAN